MGSCLHGQFGAPRSGVLQGEAGAGSPARTGFRSYGTASVSLQPRCLWGLWCGGTRCVGEASLGVISRPVAGGTGVGEGPPQGRG